MLARSSPACASSAAFSTQDKGKSSITRNLVGSQNRSYRFTLRVRSVLVSRFRGAQHRLNGLAEDYSCQISEPKPWSAALAERSDAPLSFSVLPAGIREELAMEQREGATEARKLGTP